MKSFAQTFFNYFEAQVQALDNELIVDLPPVLAEHFGKPRLYLVFAGGDGGSRDLSPTEDLLVYGSRVFDQMLALLAGRGQTAYLNFSAVVQPTAKPPYSPLPLANCREVDAELLTSVEPFTIFNFNADYVSDERRTVFMAVVLDEHGQSYNALVEMLTTFDPALLLPDIAQPLDRNRLTFLLEQATAVAQTQVQVEIKTLEAVTQARLEKVLLRLTSYYHHLSEEVDTGNTAQNDAARTDLQRDLANKISDELARHRLRVTLSPVNYALASVPFGRFNLQLATRHSQQLLSISQNLHTGQVTLIKCHHCTLPLKSVALCDHGHAAHQHCLNTCHHCDLDVCYTCGIGPCAICTRHVCGDCIAACAYCDRRLCADHIETCAICGAAFCTDHAVTCRICRRHYCQQCHTQTECTTCQSARLAPLITQNTPIPPIPNVQITRYRWRQAKNDTYVVYLGSHFFWGQMIIVTNTAGGIIFWQKVSFWQRLFKK